MGISSLSSLGTVATPQFVNGKVQLIVVLKADITAAQVQSALRGITFVTSPKGLKLATRAFTAQLTEALGTASNTYTQQIRLLKKAPKGPKGKSRDEHSA